MRPHGRDYPGDPDRFFAACTQFDEIAVLVGAALPKVLSMVAYLEYICEIQLRAMATGQPVKVLSPEVLGEALAGFSGYGQQPTKS